MEERKENSLWRCMYPEQHKFHIFDFIIFKNPAKITGSVLRI